MSNLDEKILDYELTLVVDKEFTDNSGFRADLRFSDQPERVWSSTKAHKLLSYLSLLGGGNSVPIGKKGEAYLAAKQIFENKLLSTILEGRGRIALLIDSDGGSVDTEKYYKRALKTLKIARGTKVDAFILGHACSAAFSLMCMADDVSVLPDSVLMWHFSDDGNTRRSNLVSQLSGQQFLKKSFKKELAELINFSKRSKYLRYLPREQVINDLVINAGNPDGEVYFRGDDAFEQELVDACYTDPIMMGRYYADRYLGMASTTVSDFWVLSKVIADQAGDRKNWPNFNFEEARVATRSSLNDVTRGEVLEHIYGR